METDNVEGFRATLGVAEQTELGVGEGVRQFYGGSTLSATDAGTTTYGEGVYLKQRKRDYRYGTAVLHTANYGSGDATSEKIDKWTLDVAGSRSGHFNEDVTGTYIGEGSPINIDGLWYRITSLTGGAGEATGEVVLNYAAPSGQVQYIGGKTGEWVPMTSGEMTKDGIVINEATNVNVNDQKVCFEAGQYDN